MAALKYNKIVRYQVTVKCNGPLRIGSAVGSKEEVLVHPVDQKPFVQSSSITGVLRSFYKSLPDTKVEKLFGDSEIEGKESNGSRVKISDGIFLDTAENPLKLELRPHVKINRRTGSVASENILGTDKKSGQKFNVEYIGTGSSFCFVLDVYTGGKVCPDGKKDSSDVEEDHSDKEVEKILAGLKAGVISFGGKKSNGAGNVILTELNYKAFDLTTREGRKEWIESEEHCDYSDYMDKLPENQADAFAYRVTVKGKTEGSIQVKGIAVSEFGKDAPDSENIRNAVGEYIVPGSSFKGAVRSQMEKIAEYMNKENVIEDIFGKNDTKAGKTGSIVFYDTVITEKDEAGYEKNIERRIQHRVHIDKFTGGVFNKGFFHEKNAAGNVEFVIGIKKKENQDVTLGLLILALRDLAIGVMSVGSGYSTGKGIIDVEEIRIERSGESQTTILHYQDGRKVDDPLNIVNSALNSLKGVSK